MKKHYECPRSWGEGEPLVFDWDEETGEFSGPSASFFDHLKPGNVYPRHPMPMNHAFGDDPRRSRTDVAVMVGWEHRLPEDIADAYPKWEPSKMELEIEAEDGFVVY